MPRSRADCRQGSVREISALVRIHTYSYYNLQIQSFRRLHIHSHSHHHKLSPLYMKMDFPTTPHATFRLAQSHLYLVRQYIILPSIVCPLFTSKGRANVDEEALIKCGALVRRYNFICILYCIRCHIFSRRNSALCA